MIKKYLLIVGLLLVFLPVYAVENNPVNPENKVQTTVDEKPPYPLTDSDMAWGTAQMEQMLKDRPAMAKYVRRGDDLWNWTVRQFAGEYVKGGVQWDSNDPVGSFESVSCRSDPEKGKKAYIQNTLKHTSLFAHSGEPKTGPVLWYGTAIEFCNLMNGAAFDAIDRDADNGKLSRTDFAFEMMAMEDIATNNHMHDFLTQLWIPNCQKLSLPFMDRDYVDRNGARIVKGWSREAFVKAFQDIEKHSAPNSGSDYEKMVFKDFNDHYQYYVNMYDQYRVPDIRVNNVSVPAAEGVTQVEDAFLNSIVPAAAKVLPKLEPLEGKLVVDSFESNIAVNQLGGVWGTITDQNQTGTLFNPVPFLPVEKEGSNPKKFAAHIWGHLGAKGARSSFAQLWTSLNPDSTAVDLSGFSAVQFYVKGDQKKYFFQIARTATEGHAHYRAPFTASSDWTRVTLPLSSFAQAEGGVRIERGWNDVEYLVFAVNSPTEAGQDFNLWIDDLELIK